MLVWVLPKSPFLEALSLWHFSPFPFHSYLSQKEKTLTRVLSQSHLLLTQNSQRKAFILVDSKANCKGQFPILGISYDFSGPKEAFQQSTTGILQSLLSALSSLEFCILKERLAAFL